MNKVDPEEFDPPIEPVSDKLHRLARAGAASVPVAGGVVTELLNAIVAPPFERRMIAWQHELTSVVNRLIEHHNLTAKQLASNDVLVSAIIKSSDIALRTSSEDVVSALLNGLIFIAKKQNCKEAIVALYLNTIARLTSLHFKLLRYLMELPENKQDDPSERRTPNKEQQEFLTNVEAYDPDFSNPHVTERLMQDLISEKLIEVPDGVSQALGRPNHLKMRITQFGADFIDFISKHEGG